MLCEWEFPSRSECTKKSNDHLIDVVWRVSVSLFCVVCCMNRKSGDRWPHNREASRLFYNSKTWIANALNEWITYLFWISFFCHFCRRWIYLGYGHIAPKTQGEHTIFTEWIFVRFRTMPKCMPIELQSKFVLSLSAGKIATIFYAICGIPLMLLCLSNIGDIMASSFRWVRRTDIANGWSEIGIEIRFIYWRICCFVCTREPKRRRTRRAEMQRSLSQPSRIASARPSIRRSVRVSQRTADSGIDSYCEPHLAHAYSDTELR